MNLFHAELICEGCSPRLLNDRPKIERLLRHGARIARMRVIHVAVHKFRPQGITGYALLAESHISIHTWPEGGLAVMDIFTCNSRFVEKAMCYFIEELGPSRKTVSKFPRKVEGITSSTRQTKLGNKYSVIRNRSL